MTKIDDTKLRIMVDKGMTLPQIRNDFGVSKSGLKKAMKRLGLKIKVHVPPKRPFSQKYGLQDEVTEFLADNEG